VGGKVTNKVKSLHESGLKRNRAVLLSGQEPCGNVYYIKQVVSTCGPNVLLSHPQESDQIDQQQNNQTTMFLKYIF